VVALIPHIIIENCRSQSHGIGPELRQTFQLPRDCLVAKNTMASPRKTDSPQQLVATNQPIT